MARNIIDQSFLAAVGARQVEMLAMQTRNRVENIERMHDQLLVSEKAFKGKPREMKLERCRHV